MSPEETFASRVYRWAAIYGIIVLAPLYFAPIPHPHRLIMFGFVGTALVFQVLFLVISRDPRRYLALMPVAVLEKLAFGIPAIVFLLLGHTDPITAAFGGVDLLLAVLFLYTWRRMARTT